MDLEKIFELNLTPNQYYILKLIHQNDYVTIQTKFPTFSYELEVLKKLKYILFVEYYQETENSQPEIKTISFNKNKLDELFVPKQTAFWEILSLYPLKVQTSNGGTRVLHAVSLDSKENLALKKKYEDIIKGNPELHNDIVKCLKIEIYLKKNGNSLHYMQELKTWINQRTWEKYSHLIPTTTTPETEKTSVKYGEQLI